MGFLFEDIAKILDQKLVHKYIFYLQVCSLPNIGNIDFRNNKQWHHRVDKLHLGESSQEGI